MEGWRCEGEYRGSREVESGDVFRWSSKYTSMLMLQMGIDGTEGDASEARDSGVMVGI